MSQMVQKRFASGQKFSLSIHHKDEVDQRLLRDVAGLGYVVCIELCIKIVHKFVVNVGNRLLSSGYRRSSRLSND